MKTRKNAVLLSVIALGAVAFSWREKRVRLEAEASLANMNDRAAGVQRNIERLRGRLGALADERASLQSVSEKIRLPSSELSGSAKPPEKTAAITAQGFAAMVQDLREGETSEGQRRELAWHRAKLGESYQSFVQSLGLGPAAIQRFESALLRRVEEQLDIAAVMRAHGLTLMEPTLGSLWKQAEKDYQSAQKELLGADGYREFQEFERTVSVRDFVRTFIGVTTLAGRPLSSQQAEQLVGILATTTESYVKRGSASVLSIDWDTGLKEAQKVLSPEQLRLISSYEPQGGNGGIAWMRFNKMLNDAQHEESDRRAETTPTGQSSLPKK